MNNFLNCGQGWKCSKCGHVWVENKVDSDCIHCKEPGHCYCEDVQKLEEENERLQAKMPTSDKCQIAANKRVMKAQGKINKLEIENDKLKFTIRSQSTEIAKLKQYCDLD